MLDLIEQELSQSKYLYARYDGSITLFQRSSTLQSFRENERVTILLMSLKAGGCGLNLSNASVILFVDVWWNPTTEMQTIDRVHRLGQLRDVEIVRFVAKDTIEEKILKLQEQRKYMMNSESLIDLSLNKLSTEDLKYLFE